MTAVATQPDKFWALRGGKPSDHNLVLQSWIRSHRSVAVPHQSDASSYVVWQERLIKQLLKRGALLVAALDTDPDFILGWAVTSTECVHYAWTRDKFRMKGICKDLLAPYLSKPTVYTHRYSDSVRKDSWKLGLRNLEYPKDWIYDPHHALNLATENLF